MIDKDWPEKHIIPELVLAEIDPEYLEALKNADYDVFERRHPLNLVVRDDQEKVCSLADTWVPR